ncbi:MAG: hypothetical protein HUN04_17425 [Desulfobacter sp.]|nr:MAG: hypothetical protein HUN04_17425 [Desulfobacter sp.]
MIRTEQIHFFLSGRKQPIFPGSPFWDLPLPGQHPSSGTATVGRYLLAAKDFLTRSDNPVLPNAVTALTGCRGQIGRLDISLEKHGAFYHPLKVTVSDSENNACTLVLIGAVDRPGLDLVEQEYGLMAGLGTALIPACIPTVFGAGRQKGKGMETAFFLGEWLEGFYEFHVTRTTGEECIVVWGPGEEVRHFPYGAAALLYEQAAHILTLYYDVSTGAGISPWHHAAGDFVVNPAAPGLPVRLTTVRGFSPLAEAESGDGNMLPPLLFFFLSTVLRMRLDRLDGTGPTVFLKKEVAEASINGFFRALSRKAETGPGQSAMDKGLPRDLPKVFHDFILNFSTAQLDAVTANLVAAWHPGASELEVIRENLTAHSAEISRILKNTSPFIPGPA